MEKTLKYTTLKGLLNAMSKYSQFSLNTLRSGRMCHKKHSWVKFKLTDELSDQIIKLFQEVTGEVYLFGGNSYGIYDRLIIEQRNKEFKSRYIAGQHYPSELKTLIKSLRGQ